MREIKFRAKTYCIDNNEWVYGDLHVISGRPHIHSIGSNCPFRIDTETIGQFTGLLDKNGKEIYEGDIINGYTGKGIVYFDDVHKGFRVEWIHTILDVDKSWIPFKGISQMEVISNIHDNPELINE